MFDPPMLGEVEHRFFVKSADVEIAFRRWWGCMLTSSGPRFSINTAWPAAANRPNRAGSCQMFV
jgi:hypothetical protein